MKRAASTLLPLFRSDGQARLLAHLYLRPQETTTLSMLAGELGLNHATVSREADRLERAGLIRSERVGNQRRLLRNEDSVYYASLYDLLLQAFGPVPLLERELQNVADLHRAYLYGSWAARYLGVPGEAPNDLDVLLVGAPDRHAVARLSRRLEQQLGCEVNPTIVPTSRWEAKSSAFLRSISAGPLVEIGLER